jgi:hypothetical protein
LTKKIGYIVLTLSLIVWCFVFIVPWFDIPKGKIVGITTVLIIVGEITFYLSVFLLGKAFFAKIKSKLKFWKAKPDETSLPDSTDLSAMQNADDYRFVKIKDQESKDL